MRLCDDPCGSWHRTDQKSHCVGGRAMNKDWLNKITQGDCLNFLSRFMKRKSHWIYLNF